MIDRLRHGQLILILVAMAYFFLMLGNGLITLTHPDEVFYVQTAKEMMAHKSWLAPYIFDQPQFEKPVFFYWLLIAAIRILGMTAFAARFVPAFFGILGVVVTYWLATMLFKNKRTAFLSGVILMTSVIYLALSRAVLTDMVFSIWVVLSLSFFYYGYTDGRRKAISIILCFVFSALAVLTKGLLGFVFPCSVIFAYLFYRKDFSYLRNTATLAGFLIFLVISVPWHILMIKQYGQFFIGEYWHNVHMRRIFEAEHQKSNTWYFYLVTILGGIFPWSFFSLPAGYLAYRKLKEPNPDRDKFVFLSFWIVLIYAVVQSAQSKLASYVFPVFPAVAVVMGYYFDRLLSSTEPSFKRPVKFLAYAMSFLMAGASVPLIFFAQKYSHLIGAMKDVYIFAALFLLWGAATFILNKLGKLNAVIGMVAGITAVVLIGVGFGYRDAEPWTSCKPICDVLKKVDTSDSVLLCSKFYVRGVKFYTDRKIAVIDINGEGFFSPHPVPFLNRDDAVQAFLNTQPRTYCILKKSNVKDLERIAVGRFSVAILDEIGGKYLLQLDKI